MARVNVDRNRKVFLGQRASPDIVVAATATDKLTSIFCKNVTHQLSISPQMELAKSKNLSAAHSCPSARVRDKLDWNLASNSPIRQIFCGL